MIYHLLLADDHALVREGLKQLFALTTDIRVESEATNGAQVLEALRQQKFDLVLLDMTMPGISGPDLIARIRVQEGAPPVLVLSMHNEPQIARRALTAGASGYLTKDNNPEVLLAAVRRVAGAGGTWTRRWPRRWRSRTRRWLWRGRRTRRCRTGSCRCSACWPGGWVSTR